MRVRFCLWVAVLVMICAPLLAQRRPLQTEDPEPVGAGNLRIQMGIEYLQGATFNLSGLHGDLTRLGVIGAFFGAGSAVEFQITGTIRNALDIDEQFPAFNTPYLQISGNSTDDIGDFTLGAKCRLRRETPRIPAISFRFATELPNATTEAGLGNDETNFYASVIIGKSLGRLRGTGSLGLAVLGDPARAGAQKDLMTYGLAGAFEVTPRWALVAEIHGREGSNAPGTEDQAQLRLGTRIQIGPLQWDVAGMAGMAKTDPDSGVLFGISYQFRAFKP